MKECLIVWARKTLHHPEVTAYCIFHPDHSRSSHPLDRSIDNTALDNIWRCLSDSLHVLRLNQLPCDLFRWVFSQSTILCAKRPDGHTIALLHMHPDQEPAHSAPSQPTPAIREFLMLHPDLKVL